MSEFICCEGLQRLAKSWPGRCCAYPNTLDVIIDEYNQIYGNVDDDTDEIAVLLHNQQAQLTHALAQGVKNSVMGVIISCMKSIREEIVDPREPSKVVYPLDTILIVILLAKLTGYNTAEEMCDFYVHYNLQLQVLVPGMPSPQHKLSQSTINTILGLLSADDISRYMSKHFAGIKAKIEQLIATNSDEDKSEQDTVEYQTIGFDGQELVSSYKKNEDSRRIKGGISVTTYNCTAKKALAYKLTAKKNNETDAFLELLPGLSVNNRSLWQMHSIPEL